MEQDTTTGQAPPMHKQEVVKDDGRLLTFYTFPPEEADAPGDGQTAEDAHV